MNRFLLCLGLFPCLLSAQNLIVNGGFERNNKAQDAMLSPIKPCTFSCCSNSFNDNVLGWKTFEVMTPDLLMYDTVSPCPKLPRPHQGNRMVGLIMYHPFQDGQFAFDYHELIQGTLAKPLEPGKTYRIRFWVRSDDSLGVQHLNQVFGRTSSIKPVRSGNFGFSFSKDKFNPRENFMQSQVDFPIKPQLVLETIVETNGKWQCINLDFKANQPYKYFLFGNFSFDAVTPINMTADDRMRLDNENTESKRDFWQKTKRIGYYCFDDFSMEEVNDAWMERNLLQEKGYTMPAALLFDSGKWDLKPSAQPELNRLAGILNKKPDLVLEIGGHTDNVGTDADNQRLSEQRASAVCDFLRRKGVAERQLVPRGYGETVAIAENDTEMGRQLNRRVVFRTFAP